jgi:hypothetical protein
MQTFIYFNRPDCPENIGISQLTADLSTFLQEREDVLKDYVVLTDRFTFTKPDGETGYALTFNVDDSFEN